MMYKDFYQPQNYVNRELSWIDFNGRVLEEALAPENPLLERANFLGITQSNVDEFFMVRVASLHKLSAANVTTTDASGMTPKEQLDAVNEKEHGMVEQRYQIYNDQLLPELASQNIQILHVRNLDAEQYEYVRRYFNEELMPVLTPMADDTSRPFPFISNNSLNIAIKLERDPESLHVKEHEILEGDQEIQGRSQEPHDENTENEEKFATVRVPEIYKRLVKLPGENQFVLLDELIKEFLSVLFPGYRIISSGTYRVMRDMDLDVAGDFIAMAAQLVYIKSRMLLPKHEEDEDGEDPRAGLVEMLLEYQRLKSATAFFAEKNETGRDIYVKPPERQDDAPVEYHHTVNDLIRAANKMLRRTKRRLPPPVTSFQGIVGREPAPVEGRVTAILKRFLYRMRVPFMRLFDDARNRSEIVATFLAVLELSKTRRIRLEGDGEEMELMLTNDNTK